MSKIGNLTTTREVLREMARIVKVNATNSGRDDP